MGHSELGSVHGTQADTEDLHGSRTGLTFSLHACLQLYLEVPDLKLIFFFFRKKYSKVRLERMHQVLEEGEELLMVFAERLS